MLACLSSLLATSAAQAQNASAQQAPRPFFQRVLPAVMLHDNSRGDYGLRLHLEYFGSVTGNLELHRHQYFIDDNLKMQHPRTSVAWSVRWRF